MQLGIRRWEILPGKSPAKEAPTNGKQKNQARNGRRNYQFMIHRIDLLPKFAQVDSTALGKGKK